jgi:signal peptidase II
MTPVTPIEPHLRRRDAGRPKREEHEPPRERSRPGRGKDDRLVERDVTIPVYREADQLRRDEETTPDAPPEQRTLSERALAARFFPLAGAVVVVDLATKAWASSALAERSMRVANGVTLALSYNRASAGGVSLGAHTRDLNFAGTGVVVGLLVMLAPTLTRLHRRAWIAVALIVGAGLGNLTSLASDARGVADFIALRHAGGAWVLNVADVALFVGLTLLAWTTLLLAGAAWRGDARLRVR